MTNKLPPEPISGQYYRARAGYKALYVGKMEGYLVYAFGYDLIRFQNVWRQYIDEKDTSVFDIIAPWAELLPPVEIKRWAVVVSVTNPQLSQVLFQTRGDILDVFDSKEEAEAERIEYTTPEDIEIVELTGTLPKRKVS